MWDIVDKRDHERIRERLATLYAGGTVPLLEQHYVRLDGQVIEVEVATQPVVYLGRHAAQVVARDVTERKLAERRLRESE